MALADDNSQGADARPLAASQTQEEIQEIEPFNIHKDCSKEMLKRKTGSSTTQENRPASKKVKISIVPAVDLGD